MTKNIGILGTGKLSKAIALSMAAAGFSTSIPKSTSIKDVKIRFKRRFKPIDLSDFVEPVNAYQKKQREQKARRKGRR